MSARRNLWFALCLAACAPQAWAQCAAELSAFATAAAVAGFKGPSTENPYLARTCGAVEVQGMRDLIPRYQEDLRREREARDRHPAGSQSFKYADMHVKGNAMNVCRMQAYVDRCAGAAPAASAPAIAPRAAAPQPSAPAATLGDSMSQAPDGKFSSDPQMVARRAIDRQGSVDYYRGEKRKRHVPAAEAHHCLTVAKAGGFANSCDFAVEFSFCTFRPKKGGWASFFDCEEGKGGSWQVSANSRAAVHTEAQYVLWFACRYGPTLGKPDGISPADVEYKRDSGPGRLHGRCAQWGSTAPASASAPAPAAAQAPVQAAPAPVRAPPPAAAPSEPARSSVVCPSGYQPRAGELENYRIGRPNATTNLREFCYCIPSSHYDARRCGIAQNGR